MRYITLVKHNVKKFSALVFLFFISSSVYLSAANDQVNQKGKASQIGNLKEKNFQQLVTDLLMLAGKYILTLLVGLTVLVFLFGLMKYMFKGQGSDTARSEGRKLMLWGVIGLFVMTSVWGLVAIFASVIGHTGIGIPQFK